MPLRNPPRKSSSKHSPGTPSLFGTEAEAEPARASHDAIVAHVDGGARGNPGPAGYGVHIQNAKGETIAELSVYLGHKTNNFAEYSGLLAALEYAVKHGHPRIKVVSDSELIVKQIRGEYKVKSPELKVLYDAARALIRKLEQFEIRHVLRAQNKDADRLANEAMDRKG
jgi:ribonuclease HI